MYEYLAYVAAIGTAFCWSFNSLFYEYAGRRIGSATVTHLRLWIAILLNIALHKLFYGEFFSVQASMSSVIWLAASGAIGYVAADALGFEAFVRLGTHFAMVLMTSGPIFSSILAYFFLGETLALKHLVAIILILLGIIIVIFEKNILLFFKKPPISSHVPKLKLDIWGIIFAFGAALGQAIGMIMSKIGMQAENLPPLSTNVIRVAAGAITATAVYTIAGQTKLHFANCFADRRASAQLAIGTIFGPVLGVGLLLFAIGRVQVGIVSTLCQLSPLIVVAINYFFFRKKITLLAIIGTVVAIIGAVLVFI